MNIHIRYTGNAYWDAQITLNANLFFEADRLDAAAYLIIDNGFDDPEVWRRFREAKKAALAQLQIACLDWLRIRQALEG